jgi:hypothetical protein
MILGFIGVRLHNRQDSMDKELKLKLDREEFRLNLRELKEDFRRETRGQTTMLIRLFGQRTGVRPLDTENDGEEN